MKTFTIGWLNKCRCGNKSHTVKTARGNETALWDDDAVKCNSCGRGGVIQVYEGQARVLWETDEEMAENKPMSTITKEWLQQKIADMEAARDEIPFGLDEDDCNTLDAMKLALASLEAEAVGFIVRNKETGQFGSWMHSKADWFKDDGYEVLNAYISPPAPVSVPTFDEWLEIRGNKPLGWVKDAMRESYDACRAAMLQGVDGKSPVIPDDVRRMDWLVSKTVDVREPMVYGSHSLFWSQTITDEEDDYHATKLREQIDAAMAAEQAAAPRQEVK